MKNKIWQIRQYVLFLIRCVLSKKIKNALVLDIQQELFKEEAKFYTFDEIESIRAKLLLTTKELTVEDLGAGSTIMRSNKRSIRSIAKSSLKPTKTAQLLYRFVHHFRPSNLVELGTCLGVTSSYLATANPNGKLFTIEGSRELAQIAQINFKKLNIKNITQVEGNFDDKLNSVLSQIESADFIFFDGNHKKEATLRYFDQALKYAKENSIFVFDDIYWSKGMTHAWEEIKIHSSVTLTIDCYAMGFVFFLKDQNKEHFTVYH